MLVPFTSSDDADFFHHLEMHLRSTMVDLIGRDHLAFRSAFIPVKDVVDGDLCDTYAALSVSQQTAIAGELDRTPAEVMKKVEELYMRLI